MSEAFSHLLNQRTENSTGIIPEDATVNHEDSDTGTKDGDQGNGEGNVTMSAEVLGHNQKKTKDEMTPDEHRAEMHLVSDEKHAVAHSRKKSNHPVAHSVHLVKYDFLPHVDEQIEIEVADELVEDAVFEKVITDKKPSNEKSVVENAAPVEKFADEKPTNQEKALEDIDSVVVMTPKEASVVKDVAPKPVAKVVEKNAIKPETDLGTNDKPLVISKEVVDTVIPKVENDVVAKAVTNQPEEIVSQDSRGMAIDNSVADGVKIAPKVKSVPAASTLQQVAPQPETPNTETFNVSEPQVTTKENTDTFEQKVELNTAPETTLLATEHNEVVAAVKSVADNTVTAAPVSTFVPTETKPKAPREETVSKPIITVADTSVQSVQEQEIIVSTAVIDKVIAEQPAPEIVLTSRPDIIEALSPVEAPKPVAETSAVNDQLETVTTTPVAITEKPVIENNASAVAFTATVKEAVTKNELLVVVDVPTPVLQKTDDKVTLVIEQPKEAPTDASSTSAAKTDTDVNYSVAEIKEFWDKNVKQITTKLKVVEQQPQRNLQAVHMAPQEQFDNVADTNNTVNENVFKTKMRLLSDNENELGLRVAKNKIKNIGLEDAYIDSQFEMFVPGSEALIPATQYDNGADYWDSMSKHSPLQYGMTG